MENQTQESDKVESAEASHESPQLDGAESDSPPELQHPKQKFFKSKKALIAVAAIVLLAGAGAAALFLQPSETPVTTESTAQPEIKRLGVAVGLVEGTAEYSTDAESWRALKDDTDLQEGNQVRTLADSRAVLLIDDGSAVRLDENSQIKLSNLSVEDVVITQESGQIYSRVVASETREYSVEVDDETYLAKGTAYRTFNQVTKKGVEVYHSKVNVKSKNIDVGQGKYLLSKSSKKEKENKVLGLNIEALKKDDFLTWNSKQDKKVKVYASSLGILKELDKSTPKPAPAPKPEPEPAPAPAPTAGISLSGSQSEYAAVFSWTATGVDTSKGYKLVRSETSATPTYPSDKAVFIEAGKTSYKLFLGDGKTYYYRLCAYRGNTCDSYSNVVKVTTIKKDKNQ